MEELLLGLCIPLEVFSVSSLSLDSISGGFPLNISPLVPNAVFGRGMDGRGPMRPPESARFLLDAGSGC